MSFFNNHCHDHTSNASLGFADVLCKTEELIQYAYDIGLSGITLTNHECISSHIDAIDYYEKMNMERPFTLGLGNEIYLQTDEEFIDNRDNGGTTPYYHFILTALDTEGHKQLRQLSTRAWERAFKRNIWRRVTLYSDLEEIVEQNKGHILSSSACLGSKIDRLLLEGQYKEAVKEVSRLIKIFGEDNFYLEVQPSKNNDCDQSKVNPLIWQLHEETAVKVIPTTDVHYLKKEDAFIHSVYLNSGDGDRETEEFYATTYCMDENELRNYLKIDFNDKQIEQMFAWSNEIPARIKKYNIKHNPIIPQIPIDKIPDFTIIHKFKEWYEKYPNFAFYSNREEIHEQYFFYQIEQGLIDKVVNNPNKSNLIDSYIARLDIEWLELRKISEALDTSMVSYYSTMAENIELMWEVGSLVGPGRGSAAGFLTTYILSITQIDPLPLGDYMPYWRHVALERGAEIADIDVDSEPCKKYEIVNKMKEFFGEDKVLNVATFSKISSKTALEKSCTGLNIPSDVAGYLKSLIPVNRGKTASLKECLYGDKEKGIAPVYELVSEIEKYPRLKECALGIEGVITNRGCHAAGVVVTNEPYTEYIAAMRSPEGVIETCYDLWKSEEASCIKFDMLTVAALQKIHKTMDELIKAGHMEWQGSVKATYDKYLSPDVIEYEDPKMWEILPSIYSIFQFDTPTSSKALSATKPQSAMDLSAANSLLRLMPDNAEETPIEKYIRYKNDEQEWVNDTTAYGLNDEERECLREYLGDAFFLADSQEKIMRLSISDKVAGYGLKEANALRKAIAKKDTKLQEKAKTQFFEYGRKIGTREIFLDYVWNVVFAASLGYSFSQIHSYSYSIIAIQELNLNYFYNPVFWNTACLEVEASGSEEGSGAGTDYGEVAKAIYKMRKHGIEVSPPSINHSELSFTPIEATNTILFGLGGIAGINPVIAQQILDNRPYTSFKQFYEANAYKGSAITPSKFRQLIKAGCFDELNPNRVSVMKKYIVYSTPKVTSLTMANMQAIIKSETPIPKALLSPYNFYKYVTSKQFYYGVHPKFKSKKLYYLDPRSTKYFNKNCKDSLQESIDYFYDNDMLIVVDKSIEKLLKVSLDGLKEYINTDEFLEAYNKKLLLMKYDEFVPNKSTAHWALEATSFYHNGEHELDKIDKARYLITDFKDLPEEPVFVEKNWGTRTWKQYSLSQIGGVVLDRNDANKIVTLLTSDLQVVNIRFHAGLFAHYKRQISEEDENGKSVVIDPSYFSRGQLLIVCGYRNGEDFTAKKYSKSVYQHICQRIVSIDENTGEAVIQSERLLDEKDYE